MYIHIICMYMLLIKKFRSYNYKETCSYYSVPGFTECFIIFS